MKFPNPGKLGDDGSPPAEGPRPIPVFSIKGALSPLLLLPLLLLILTILFAPITILDQWGWALKFTDWIQRMMPFMNMKAHAYSTAYPQVALLAHSLMVAVIPMMSLVWLWQSLKNYPTLLVRSRMSGGVSLKTYVLLSIIGVPFFLGVIYFFVSLPGDPSFAKGFTTHSRFGFAFLSLSVAYVSSGVLGGQILFLRLFIDTCLKKDS